MLTYIALFVSVSCCVAAFVLRRVYWHPLSSFPGPFWPTLSSYYQFRVLLRGEEGQWYRHLHEKYAYTKRHGCRIQGPIVRCGPNHLSFNDPDLVQTVYHRKTDKTDFHQEFSCPRAVFNRKSHTDHATAKRRFGHAYSLTRIAQQEDVIDRQIRDWIAVLKDQASVDSRVDWETWARYFSFDLITAISFGEATGFMHARSDIRGLIENMDKTMYRQKLSLYPPISKFARNNPLGRRYFVATPDDKDGLGIFIAEIRRTIRMRQKSRANDQKSSTDGKSMLDQWLSVKTVDGDSIPTLDIEDQILMDMLAGPDSISLMTTNLTFLMASHPDVLQKAQKEADEAFQKRQESDWTPTYEDCLNMPYINACVREGLRIVASTFPRRRSSPSNVPIFLNGKLIPAGTSIAASACEIGRHKNLYGENADEFVPERWLGASKESLRTWETLDVHWGFGVRKCLGRHIGAMVLYKYLVLLLHNFDIKLEPGTKINIWSYPSSQYIRLFARDV